jgi:hypothetical protein
MKKIALPILLLFAGLCCIAYPLFQSPGDIDLKITPATVIMPSAYKVYANPDVLGGRYNLFKAVIKNSGAAEIKNLKVQYRIPNLINDWTDVPSSTNLLPGQTAVVTCFPVFPQSITERNTSSKEKTEIKITYGSKASPTEKDESFPFDITSVNDIVFTNMADQDKAYTSDYAENRVLYACMVSSEDPIIKQYAASVQQKILCGEAGAGVGTNGAVGDKEMQEKVRVMEGVYNATLISHMVYSETQSGVSKFSDNTSGTEHIRLPREVVAGNTGLCIELALLHASVYKAAGLHPVIFLVPGHAYPGIKVGNSYLALESTGIGGEGLGSIMNAGQALQSGMKELNTFFEESRKNNPQYMMLDIDQLYEEGFKDMELKPDPIMSGQADKITQGWPTCLISAVARPAENATANNNISKPKEKARVSRHGGGAATGWSSYGINSISFEYPVEWAVYNRPVAQIPQMLSIIMSPDKLNQVESYHVSGAQSPEQAMAYIRGIISRMGENIQYQEANMQNGLTRFNGSTYANGSRLNWVGLFRNAGDGVDGVIVGTNGPVNNPLLQRIFDTIR